MKWTPTKTRSGRRSFDIATEHGPVTTWGFVNGVIAAHSPGEDGLVWDFTHLPTGRRIGGVACNAARADYMTYLINHEAVNLDSADLVEVRTALSEWAAPLSVAEKLKELAG